MRNKKIFLNLRLISEYDVHLFWRFLYFYIHYLLYSTLVDLQIISFLTQVALFLHQTSLDLPDFESGVLFVFSQLSSNITALNSNIKMALLSYYTKI